MRKASNKFVRLGAATLIARSLWRRKVCECTSQNSFSPEKVEGEEAERVDHVAEGRGKGHVQVPRNALHDLVAEKMSVGAGIADDMPGCGDGLLHRKLRRRHHLKEDIGGYTVLVFFALSRSFSLSLSLLLLLRFLS